MASACKQFRPNSFYITAIYYASLLFDHDARLRHRMDRTTDTPILHTRVALEANSCQIITIFGIPRTRAVAIYGYLPSGLHGPA